MTPSVPGLRPSGKVRLLSRASDLATTQARLVAGALRRRWPDLQVELVTRSSLGDRSPEVTLSRSVDKGLFTADLSDALATGSADLVVHSWKDLPVIGRPDTVIAGTLERADVRDVLLVRRDAVTARPRSITVLTSSPRRAWQLHSSLAPFLPWPIESLEPHEVRGNVPTRLEKLVDGDATGLVVAKAALDRLLAAGDAAGSVVRRVIDACRWMVLPVRQFPAAPAQGALAIEVAANRPDVIELVRSISHDPTARACETERAILASHGGGCHEAIGAIVLMRPYGVVTSVRGKARDGHAVMTWTLDRHDATPRAASAAHVWPRPAERTGAIRRSRSTVIPNEGDAWFVARADALPDDVPPSKASVIWAAGSTTWLKLATRGIWVNGCAEGLGDEEQPNVDQLAGQALSWIRLTHGASDAPGAIHMYDVEHTLPEDLQARSHFYWTSGSLFLEALRRHPSIKDGWHASGPGRTSRVIREALNRPDRASIWLDYDEWLKTICP